ncbi:hypothetical protein J6590_063026 [Homalodisca vitripennis]|nr:hypothetical protein J6590_063026 [Homalodisca vitripennis]
MGIAILLGISTFCVLLARNSRSWRGTTGTAGGSPWTTRSRVTGSIVVVNTTSSLSFRRETWRKSQQRSVTRPSRPDFLNRRSIDSSSGSRQYTFSNDGVTKQIAFLCFVLGAHLDRTRLASGT